MLLTRLDYVSRDDTGTTVQINDFVTISVNKSTEVKNNIMQITLKNPTTKYDSTYYLGEHVTTVGTNRFNEEDKLSLYAKWSDDGDDVTGTWHSSDNLLGQFIAEEVGQQQMENSTRITLRCVDRMYLLFNKVWTYAYGTSGTWTAPGMVRHTARNNSEGTSRTITTFTGTNNDDGVEYALDANFLSEGGNIKDYRTVTEGGPSTQLDGSLSSGATTITVDSTTGFKDSGTLVITNGTTSEHVSYTGITSTLFTGVTRGIDDTTDVTHSDNTNVYQGFPEVLLSKIWKPIFEWFSEISQTGYTNYTDETGAGNTEFYNRAFILWMDKNNSLHWMDADQNVDHTIDIGDADFRGFRLNRSVFDAVNFVIYNAGEDMNGNGILYYYYDETSELDSLKMRYQPMTEITNTFIQDDITIYNTSRDTSSTQDKLRQYPASYSPPITDWSFKNDSNAWRDSQGESARTSLTSDSEYNESLREAAKWRGLQEAIKITNKTSGLRYQGQVVVKGSYYNPGDLIEITNRQTGIVEQKLRVTQVTSQINVSQGWENTLEVEEDEKSA